MPVIGMDGKVDHGRLVRAEVVDVVVEVHVAHPDSEHGPVEAVRGRQHVAGRDEGASALVDPLAAAVAPPVRGHPRPGAQRVHSVLVDGARYAQPVLRNGAAAHSRYRFNKQK